MVIADSYYIDMTHNKMKMKVASKEKWGQKKLMIAVLQMRDVQAVRAKLRETKMEQHE